MDLSREIRHLTDAELFGIALPAGGAPEALPAHLSDCLACTRALSEWKAAARDLASEGDDAMARRTPEEWADAGARTMAAIRRDRFARRALPHRWAIGIAAAVLLFAVALPLRRASTGTDRPLAVASSEMSPQDQADDKLLRDVARLSRGDDSGSWSALVPEPSSGAGTHEEDRL